MLFLPSAQGDVRSHISVTPEKCANVHPDRKAIYVYNKQKGFAVKNKIDKLEHYICVNRGMVSFTKCYCFP